MRVLWVRAEGPRVAGVELLPPEAKEGTDEGRVTFIGDAMIELRTTAGTWERYMARQVKGDGGRWRPDGEILHQIERLKKGDRVRVSWKYNERKQIGRIEMLDGPREGAKEREGRDAPVEREGREGKDRKEGDRPAQPDRPKKDRDF